MADWWRTKLSRRALGRLSAGVAGLASTLALPPIQTRARSAGAQGPAEAGLEPIRLKRAGIGLRAWDPERAFNGFTLFRSGGGGGSTLYLIDMEGTVVHTWRFPYGGTYGYLTERGTLFFNGTIPNPDFPGRVAQLGVALEADWDGNILWEVRNPDHHHDGIRLRNGNVLVVCYGVVPPAIAARVVGGRPGDAHDWGMDGDYLQEVTTDGRVVWEWRAWEHLDPVADSIPWPMDERGGWTHANGVTEWPNGDITLSFRNISTVITINRQTGLIVWKLGSPPLSGQHAPTPLPSGNLLLFDNGPHRFDVSLPYSRVLEIDVPSQQIVWEYHERRLSDFFSPRISNAQRLPNGNTLINEGWFGRFFEVTPEGDVVWEYVNPYFVVVPPNPPGGVMTSTEINQVFRAYRYSAEEIERARATGA
jgi:hypothetical protein